MIRGDRKTKADCLPFGTRSTEIIAETSLSQSTVERCLAELRKQGRVAYVGSKKNGGYEAV